MTKKILTKKRGLCLWLILCSFLLVNANLHSEHRSERPWFDDDKSFDERIELLVSAMTLEEKTSQLLNDSPAIERLGIPAYEWWNEALHGVARSGKATVFPQTIGMAATFDTELMTRVGSAISDEARAINNDLVSRGRQYIRYMGLSFWSPNVNIFRDPRWGRGQETYGEDPYLSGQLGAAFIRGMQGDHPKYLKTAACAKHFAVHSGPEALRHEFNAMANLKDLHETYLPAFKICVDAGVEAVMCAYNRTNDLPCCGSHPLLVDVLRKQWGFQGHVVSDCGALRNFHQKHKSTRTAVESAAMALKAGVDINCGKTFEKLNQAVEKGLVTESLVDERLRKVLKTRFRLGMFDSPQKVPYSQIDPSVISGAKHRQLAREVAQKSVVLLQNKNQTLPLKKDIPFVYLGGPFMGDVRSLIGNYHGVNNHFVTLLEGVVSKTSPSTRHQFRSGSLVADSNKNPMDWYSGLAKSADATIVALGLTILMEGEEGEAIASDAKGDNLSMQLPEAQMAYLRKMAQAKKKGGKKLIAVIFAGCPLDLKEVCELADAVIYAWYPGQEGGAAIADVIFGDVSPRGKLPLTFPASLEDLPPYDDYNMTGRTYKYFKKKPLYPFGFGMSYGHFKFSKLQLKNPKADSPLSSDISFTITNTSHMAAEEVVQMYVSLNNARVIVPQSELKAVQTISLQPGQSKTLSFSLQKEMFEYVRYDGLRFPHKGKATISIGNASPSERSKELGADFKTLVISCP